MSYDRIDIVYALDCWQTHSPDAVRCPNPDHGKLWPDASGTVLMCPMRTDKTPCGYVIKPSAELIAKATTEAQAHREIGAQRLRQIMQVM